MRIPAPAAPSLVTNPGGFRGYVNFVIGDHGSIIDPTASMAVTTEMQAEAISFTGAPIPRIPTTPPLPPVNPTPIDPTPPGTSILLLIPPVIQP